MRSATKNLVYRPRRPWDSNLNYQGSARGALPLEPLALICCVLASDFRAEWGAHSPVFPGSSGDTHCWEDWPCTLVVSNFICNRKHDIIVSLQKAEQCWIKQELILLAGVSCQTLYPLTNKIHVTSSSLCVRKLDLNTTYTWDQWRIYEISNLIVS